MAQVRNLLLFLYKETQRGHGTGNCATGKAAAAASLRLLVVEVKQETRRKPAHSPGRFLTKIFKLRKAVCTPELLSPASLSPQPGGGRVVAPLQPHERPPLQCPLPSCPCPPRGPVCPGTRRDVCSAGCGSTALGTARCLGEKKETELLKLEHLGVLSGELV